MGSLLKRSKILLNKGLFSDVTFVLKKNIHEEDGECEMINAHKYILSVSNPIFHSLLMETAEGIKDVRITDINATIFKLILEYIYTNEYPSINAENWAPVLHASVKYELYNLKEKCLEYVESHCDVRNALEFFILARNHSVESLVPFVKSQIGCNPEKSANFLLKIKDVQLLTEFLSLDELDCEEMFIFNEALKWAEARLVEQGDESGPFSGPKLREALGSAFYEIRFPIITSEEFNSKVIPTGVLTDDEFICILKKKSSFKSKSRMRSCNRFINVYRSKLQTKCHSLKFKVSCKVNLYGFGIYMPCEEGQVVSGKVFLKQFEEKGEDKVLRDKSFSLEYDKMLTIGHVNFVSCIEIHPDTWYLAVLELDNNVQTRVGIDGKSSVTIDDTKWTFTNANGISNSETSILKGQIPIIKFSKLD